MAGIRLVRQGLHEAPPHDGGSRRIPFDFQVNATRAPFNYSSCMANPRTRTQARTRSSRLSLIALLAGLSLLGACTRDLDSTGTCSILCPETELDVQQVVLEPISMDTTIAIFPLRGEEESLLLSNEGTSLDTRAFYRFDGTPTRYLPLGQDSTDITVLHDAYFRVRMDTARATIAAGSVVEVYDVDGDTPDADVQVLLTRFTPDRLFGSVTLSDPVSTDTLRVPLDPGHVLTSLLAKQRIRVGVRVVAPDGRVVIPVAPLEAALVLNPLPDSDVSIITSSPASSTPSTDPALRRSLTSYMLVHTGSAPLPDATVAAGGMPGARSLLRFDIPASIIDSASIVRATLVLTQRPVAGALESDSALLVPVPVQASDAVTDVVQSILLSGHPGGGLDSRVIDTLRLAANGEGPRELELQGLLSVWRSGTAYRPQRSIVLGIDREGLNPVQLHFHSREAPEGLRPRLRITYIPRVDLGIP
jgi:hypothetical protein